MSVVEGLRDVPDQTLDEFLVFSKETITQMTEGRSEAHFAVKLTAFISMEIMEKISKAQKQYVHNVLQLNYKSDSASIQLSRDQLS